jgi:glycosyltransferase involved in cell wall biosynthesis
MAERLRLAQLSPVASLVTPQSTGSIEQLVSLLTEELVRRGHEVTLFAAGDSITSAVLRAVYPQGYEDDPALWNWRLHETMHAAAVFEEADRFDVIHSHAYHYALPFTRLVRTPVVHSYHILPDPDVARAFARYPEAHLTAFSYFQRRAFGENPDVTVIPHGVDTRSFPFWPEAGKYLFFLGRLFSAKGPVEAIELARRAGMRLALAGPKEDEDFFKSEIAPLIDGDQIDYVGPVNVRERGALLAGAAALLYPVRQPEPFGLVLVEAMACGTPVLAVGIGAVPEIVTSGVIGYVAESPALLAGRVRDVLELDRARVRREAVARFDYRRMVDWYEALYRRLAVGARGDQ